MRSFDQYVGGKPTITEWVKRIIKQTNISAIHLRIYS